MTSFDAEQPGDLRVAELVEVGEHHGNAVLVRQVRYGLTQLRSALTREQNVQRAARPGGDRVPLDIVRTEQPALPAAAPEAIDATVTRDSDDPALERPGPIELIVTLPDPEKDLLHGVVSLIARTQEVAAGLADAPSVRPKQSVEIRAIMHMVDNTARGPGPGMRLPAPLCGLAASPPGSSDLRSTSALESVDGADSQAC